MINWIEYFSHVHVFHQTITNWWFVEWKHVYLLALIEWLFLWMRVQCSRSVQSILYMLLEIFFVRLGLSFTLFFVRFFSVALHGATVEIIQLNRHLRHWFSVFFSMNARIEYMFLVEYGFVLRKTQRSLAHHGKKMYWCWWLLRWRQ